MNDNDNDNDSNGSDDDAMILSLISVFSYRRIFADVIVYIFPH